MVFSAQMMNLWGWFLLSLTWVKEAPGQLRVLVQSRGCWTPCIYTPKTKKQDETRANREAWPKGSRNLKHWPQMFVYFTQSFGDSVRRAGRAEAIPWSPLPRGHHSRSVTHPHSHWIPATLLGISCLQREHKQPRVFGQGLGVRKLLVFFSSVRKALLQPPCQGQGLAWWGSSRVGTPLLMYPNHQIIQQLL